MNNTFNKARTFIYRNARPLDMARWQYHFEGGSKETVLTALAAYQNEDGGFGHALEPDAWNPNSSPMQTWTATEILREIVFNDNTHPIIQGILRYLAGGKDFEGRVWYNSGQCNNDYPHAPWWHTEGNSASYSNYSTTACLAGFIIRFANKGSEIYKLGCRIVKEAYDAYFGQDLLGDTMTAGCYVQLWHYCEEAGTMDIIDLAALKERLCAQVKHSITQNTAEWETSYICKPSQFFNSQASIFYADNKEIAEYECEYIIKSQLEDGSWGIPWSWADYLEEWAVSKNWWKSNGAILNMLYLKGMGELVQTVTAVEHYDMLIDEECDPFRDGEILKNYMKRWDGDAFYNNLNLTNEKVVLEVGIGTGRVAKNVLDIGCKSLTGLDISPKTLARAQENLLSKYNNVELLLQSIEDFNRENYYDVIYSVLTFMHIENKEKALTNIVRSLKPGGNVVLSISKQHEWLDCGRKLKMFPKEPEYYIEILKRLNCDIIETIDLIDTYIYPPTGEKQPEYGQKVSTIINARRK